jgi:hypothetical protein
MSNTRFFPCVAARGISRPRTASHACSSCHVRYAASPTQPLSENVLDASFADCYVRRSSWVLGDLCLSAPGVAPCRTLRGVQKIMQRVKIWSRVVEHLFRVPIHAHTCYRAIRRYHELSGIPCMFHLWSLLSLSLVGRVRQHSRTPPRPDTPCRTEWHLCDVGRH